MELQDEPLENQRDPVEKETEKILDGINENLSNIKKLRGHDYNIVYDAIKGLVKENMFYRQKKVLTKRKFPLNSPLYYCAKATVVESGSTWSVNVAKQESFDALYQSVLAHFKEKVKHFTIKTITIYANESAMWMEETPLAVFPVTND